MFHVKHGHERFRLVVPDARCQDEDSSSSVSTKYYGDGSMAMRKLSYDSLTDHLLAGVSTTTCMHCLGPLEESHWHELNGYPSLLDKFHARCYDEWVAGLTQPAESATLRA
jgi:hypothetical protein